MDVETKPLLHFNIDNIKVEEYYKGFEDIQDPLFDRNESTTSNLLIETAYNRNFKQEINGEDCVINNECDYDSSSDESEEEFRVYPSKTEDITLATGMTRIIEKLLRNKELLKNVKLEDEISTSKAEESDADDEVQLEESRNTLISDSNHYTERDEREEMYAGSRSNLGTLQFSLNNEKTYDDSLHEKVVIGNKLEEISCNDNFNTFALTRSVTITPLVSKLPNGINKSKQILEGQNLDINYPQSLVSISNNKTLASKTISNEKNIFTSNNENLKQLLNKPCKNDQQEHNQNLETQMHKDSRRYDLANYHHMMDGLAMNSKGMKQNLETQIMYEDSSQYDLSNYHDMMDSNSDGVAMNSTYRKQNIETQILYKDSSQYDLPTYHHMMDSNSNGFALNSTNKKQHLETQMFYKNSSLHDHANYHHTMNLNGNAFARNSTNRKQNLGTHMMNKESSQYDLTYHNIMETDSSSFAKNRISHIAQSWHNPSAMVVNQHPFQQELSFQTLSSCIDNRDINSTDKARPYSQSKDSLNSSAMLPPWTNNQITSGCNQMQRSASNNIIIPCIYCPFKTTDFHNWFFHNRGFHKENMVICPFCGYLQNKKPYMQTHVCSVHLGYKPYSCHICPFTTGWKSYLKIHLLKHKKSQ